MHIYNFQVNILLEVFVLNKEENKVEILFAAVDKLKIVAWYNFFAYRS